uniref:Uncharacterized protein n=1 Tax=Physcomitrium patens TaxID=3218 RepID=A0A2K1J6P6_PHYPA|nr:hypothetical protein PHYPA_020311 [Physcomitrium patens]
MYIVLLSPEFVTSRGLSQFRIRKQSNLIVSDIYSTDSRACTGLNSASYHVEVTIILIAGFVPVRDQRYMHHLSCYSNQMYLSSQSAC